MKHDTSPVSQENDVLLSWLPRERNHQGNATFQDPVPPQKVPTASGSLFPTLKFNCSHGAGCFDRNSVNWPSRSRHLLASFEPVNLPTPPELSFCKFHSPKTQFFLSLGTPAFLLPYQQKYHFRCGWRRPSGTSNQPFPSWESKDTPTLCLRDHGG